MVKRTIEELNLMDDFLFQAVISHGKEGEEVCRILLNTILNTNITKVRVVPQKSFLGADTMHHGIRLDAYVEDISNEGVPGVEGVAEVKVLPDIYDVEPHDLHDKEHVRREP